MSGIAINRLSIAIVAYEANRAFCTTLGDYSFNPWEQAPDWQKYTNIAGVEAIADGRITTPEQSHEAWMQQKIAEGWQYGEIKNVDHKLHPCLVAYDKLPVEQQAKDRLFFALVTALLPLIATAAAPDTTAAVTATAATPTTVDGAAAVGG